MPRKTRLAAASQEFARRLHAAMLKKGWNQSDLARAAWKKEMRDKRGYSQPVGKDRISVYLKGRTLPDAANLQRLADALGMTIGELSPVNSDVAPVDRDSPKLTFTMLPDGKTVLLQINYVVPIEIASEIVAILSKLETETSPDQKKQVQFLNTSEHQKQKHLTP
jgi:transcriptional regulator with XRE-family HTH domain